MRCLITASILLFSGLSFADDPVDESPHPSNQVLEHRAGERASKNAR